MTRTTTFHPDDVVITPLGRKALVIRCRLDGKLDARYLGPDQAFDGSVILDPKTCEHCPTASGAH
jgi:hypothetical protein